MTPLNIRSPCCTVSKGLLLCGQTSALVGHLRLAVGQLVPFSRTDTVVWAAICLCCEATRSGQVRIPSLVVSLHHLVRHAPLRDPLCQGKFSTLHMNVLQTLDQCKTRLEGLIDTVERCRTPVNSAPASPTAPPPTPTPPSNPVTSMSAAKRAHPRCHECHGPLGPTNHGQYQHGLDVCQLEHYRLCVGGIVEGKDRGGHIWRGCPSDYQPPEASSIDVDTVTSDRDKTEDVFCDFPGNNDQADGDSDSSGTASSKHTDQSYFPSRDISPPGSTRHRTRSKPSLVEPITKSRPRQHSSANGASGLSNTQIPKLGPEATAIPGDDDVDRLLEAELAEIARLEEIAQKREKLVQARIRKQQAADTIERLKKQERGEGVIPKVKDHHDAVDHLLKVNAPLREDPRATSTYQGPTMNEMRKDVGNGEKVERLMEDVYRVPALSNARNHLQGQHGQVQPRLKQAKPAQPRLHQDYNQSRESNPEYPNTRGHDEPHFRWVNKKDSYGDTYRTLEEVSPARPIPAPRHRTVVPRMDGWVYDEVSGHMYQSRNRSCTPTGRTYYDRGTTEDRHCAGSAPVRSDRQAFRSPERRSRDYHPHDRHYGSGIFLANPSEDREGKLPTIASHARYLPMEYARSATLKNMNFALFMYGAVHELHSASIGLTPPMEKEVMEAKLQHLMNVIHVTCLNATAADFKPVAWSVGRTYHNLVQAKVDCGREHWLEFEHLHRSSPHAAEMVAAEREHRTALMKNTKKGDKQEDKDPKLREKRPCPTWNEYEVEGKCKWEAENAGQKCNRDHSCSYCTKKGGGRTLHQARFCKRKLEDEK